GPPMSGALVGLFAVNDPHERLPLARIRARVDDDLHLPPTLEYRSRPCVDQRNLEPIELNVAEMPEVDAHHLESPAVTVRRQRLELAWTGVDAVAAAELDSFDVPIDAVHR